MTSKEIQLIIKQAVQEAREETKKEIYHQIKIITDIDPASDEGLHKLRDVLIGQRAAMTIVKNMGNCKRNRCKINYHRIHDCSWIWNCNCH